jgi:hypothetical protein
MMMEKWDTCSAVGCSVSVFCDEEDLSGNDITNPAFSWEEISECHISRTTKFA